MRLMEKYEFLSCAKTFRQQANSEVILASHLNIGQTLDPQSACLMFRSGTSIFIQITVSSLTEIYDIHSVGDWACI